MRKIVFIIALLLPVLAKAQTGTAIFSVTNGKIVTKSQFLDPLETGYNLPTLKYTLKYPITISLPTSRYTFKTGRFVGWEDDPGDYDVLEISKNGQQLLLHRELEGILKYKNTKYSLPNYTMANLFAQYADNDYFISVPLSTSSKALIVMGKSYPTDLPKLIIIVITESEVKLVYYKSMGVSDISKTSNSFSMELLSEIPEYVEGNNTTPTDITCTIWLENGVLRFKDN